MGHLVLYKVSQGSRLCIGIGSYPVAVKTLCGTNYHGNISAPIDPLEFERTSSQWPRRLRTSSASMRALS